jgi:hypothetical protein
MKIKELKEDYPLVYKAAMDNLDEHCDSNYEVGVGFTWCFTPEGSSFWLAIREKNFKEAKEICPHLFEQEKKENRTEERIDKFKKGDYIVLLSGPEEDGFYLGVCYKQYKNETYISVEEDCDGDKNAWASHPFDKSRGNDWRYATAEEIIEYDRLAGPFDVSTLGKEEEEEVVNTYGLKVGDEIPVEVLNAWEQVNNNRCDEMNGLWRRGCGMFKGNRIIEKFKLIHGHTGFLVSDTMDVYIKAEGFKEFMENFGKEEEVNLKGVIAQAEAFRAAFDLNHPSGAVVLRKTGAPAPEEETTMTVPPLLDYGDFTVEYLSKGVAERTHIEEVLIKKKSKRKLLI